jgi:hypothetical protein
MSVWFDDPQQLIRKDQLLNFWPSSDQTKEERVNSTTRFVLYSGALLFLIKRDNRILLVVFLAIAILFVMYKGKIIKDPFGDRPTYAMNKEGTCQLPTADNPLGNVLMSDFLDQPNRPPACYYPSVSGQVRTLLDDIIPYDSDRSRTPLPQYQRNAAARQFVSMPVTDLAGDQTGFAEWCYGKKNRPMCRDDPSMCDPNARGAQLESLRGTEMSGILRKP